MKLWARYLYGKKNYVKRETDLSVCAKVIEKKQLENCAAMWNLLAALATALFSV